MRRSAAVALATLLLAGCGGDEKPMQDEASTPLTTSTTKAKRVPKTSTSSTTTLPSPEDLFLEAIDAAGLRTGPDPFDSSKTLTLTDEELLRAGEYTCQDTATGLPPDPSSGFPGRTPAEYLIVNEDVLEGTPNGERAKLAIKYLCPENQQYLDQALSGTFPATPRNEFPDGRYTVQEGIEPHFIPPGTYEALSVSNCYWERVDSAGRTIDNDFVTGAPIVVVTIRPADAGFNSIDCGMWRRSS